MIVLSLKNSSGLVTLPKEVEAVEVWDPTADDIIKLRALGVSVIIVKIVDIDPNTMLDCNIDYIDFDCKHHIWGEGVELFFSKFKVIVSYHNFEETPKNIDTILADLKYYVADFIKIATYANNINDSLLILNLLQNNKNLIAVAMGENGYVSRVLAERYGSYFTYVALDESSKTAEGQLIVNSYPIVNEETKILGLIGDPVNKSLGFRYHNEYYKSFGINAVYLPFPLRQKDCATFFDYFRKLDFYGCSITMPLKEVTASYLDNDYTGCAVVNTVVNINGVLNGYNTDGSAFWELVQECLGDINGLHVVIVGSGGVAKSISSEGKRRGAKLFICSRNHEKARKLAEIYNIGYGTLPERCDVVVNSTPVGMFDDKMSINLKDIKVNLVVDFISNPSNTALIRFSKKVGIATVDGLKIFYRQASKQNEIWFSNDKVK